MSELRAILSVAELATLANISRQKMGRLLETAQVPTYRHGRSRLVFLAAIRMTMPMLWESIRDYRRIVPLPKQAVRRSCPPRPLDAKDEEAKNGNEMGHG